MKLYDVYPLFDINIVKGKGEFPSGQRGQTVNLLALPSVVRIHLRPFTYLLRVTVPARMHSDFSDRYV